MCLVAANVRRSLIIILPSTGGPAEPMDSTGGNPIEKHCYRLYSFAENMC